MNSLIIRYSSKVFAPLLILFSVYLLLRGHHLPGGGFLGGLFACAGFVLTAMGSGVKEARRQLIVEPHFVAGIGLLLAVVSGSIPVFINQPFLTGVWTKIEFLGLALDLGTPLLFDVGVYLVVLGSTLMIFFHLKT